VMVLSGALGNLLYNRNSSLVAIRYA
jgi:hypothetical protein